MKDIFVRYTSNRGLIDKEFKKLNNKKSNNKSINGLRRTDTSLKMKCKWSINSRKMSMLTRHQRNYKLH